MFFLPLRKRSLTGSIFASYFLLFTSVLVGSARGQVDSSTDGDAANAPSSGIRFTLVWNSKHGAFTYVPEKWGDLHLKLENTGNDSKELLCATYFDAQPNLQFGRRLWLPAHSRLQISHPAVVPKLDAKSGRTANFRSLVFEAGMKNEVLVKNDLGRLVHEGSMLITHSARNTGLVSGFRVGGIVPDDVMDILIAARVSQKLPNRVAVLADPYLPTDENYLNYLDQIVIADESIVDDFAAIAALRRWMNSGGRLWVMLERAGPLVLERLMGDDYSGRIVDRVGLTSVRIDEATTTTTSRQASVDVSLEYDDPVEMVRMVPGDFKVAYTVNGWPAALTKTCGEGRLLVTTLGPRGWIKPGQYELVDSKDPQFWTKFSPRPSMYSLAEGFFSIRTENTPAKREKDTRVGPVLETVSQEYIGYSIPSWGLIVGTLASFSIALIAAGMWLIRIERLEHLGWTGSILAIIFGAILFGIGRSSRQSVPATLASVQLARAIKGTDDVRTEGAIAVYHPDGSQTQISTTEGGLLWPDMTGLEGTNRRLVTTDLNHSYWQNLSQAAGMRLATFARSEWIPARIEARTTFDANGLVGTWPKTFENGTDALVVTQLGRIGVKKRDDTFFTANADDVFEQDQYLDANLMGEEQIRRRRILERLLIDKARKGYREQPQLIVWSNQSEHGFEFGEGLKHRGTSLLSVPLTIERPTNGTIIQIPSPLLVYRTRSNPDGSPSSPIWNDNRGEWQERSTPGLNWLAIQVPRELLPLNATWAKVQIKVTGPVGRIELMGLKQGQITSLNTVIDPIGTLSFEVTDADVLSISDEGIISLGISGGDPTRPELTNVKAPASGSEDTTATSKLNKDAKVNYWKIESLAVQIRGETTDPVARSNE